MHQFIAREYRPVPERRPFYAHPHDFMRMIVQRPRLAKEILLPGELEWRRAGKLRTALPDGSHADSLQLAGEVGVARGRGRELQTSFHSRTPTTLLQPPIIEVIRSNSTAVDGAGSSVTINCTSLPSGHVTVPMRRRDRSRRRYIRRWASR